ncbi:MAG: metallophosphoesterase [Gammaproteobacteria bacterium]
MRSGLRIGLIADTHMPGAIRELWPQVYAAFDGVDLVLHGGDLHTLEIVDRLGELAPTHVSAGNGDVGLSDPRLRDTWTFELGGVHLGMIHRFPMPGRKPREHLDRYAERHFGALPQVVIFGHTHQESLHRDGDRLYINPGSPTLPQNQALRPGTIGLLEIHGTAMTATLLQLTGHGAEPHPSIAPLSVAIGAIA